MKKPFKAFILAAGFGTRLGSITESIPKALVPFFNGPLIHILIRQLSNLAIDEIFVNGHYLWQQMQEALASFSLERKIKITFCHEWPKILGTAGAMGAVRDQVKGCDLLVFNSDIITDFDLNTLVNKHQSSNAIATMGLLAKRRQDLTPVWCEHDRIIAIGGPRPSTQALDCGFSCIQVLSEEFFEHIPPGPSDSMPIYKKLISTGSKIVASVQDPLWFDIGTPASYYEANMHLLSLVGDPKLEKIPICLGKQGPILLKKNQSSHNEQLIGPFFARHSCSLGAGSKLGPFVVNLMEEQKLGSGIEIKNSILLPSAKISPGEKLDGIIVGNNFRLNMNKINQI